jgi:uncharacterized membrane protein
MFDDFRARLGQTVAPPRFLLFGMVFVAVTALVGPAATDLLIALLVGFDAAALVFLLTIPSLLNDDTDTMRHTAQLNDANRVVLLAITVLISVVILFAIGTLIASKEILGWKELALIVGTLMLTWVFGNTVFALHYAHLYYLKDGEGDRGGLDVPHVSFPDYWDFLYFSFTLGMTFQTSDITICAAHIRKVALGHSMAAFVFNVGVVAFVVNALGGL